MSGITNRPDSVEAENQERVERKKDELTDFTQVNRPRKDHPVDKDRAANVTPEDEVAEPGVGRGTEHIGGGHHH
jgi:hypothetical protein